jgi:hypothetical protein
MIENMVERMTFDLSKDSERTTATVIANLKRKNDLECIQCEESLLFTRLMGVIHIARTTDYSGMSDAEKYRTVYERFEKAFGKDFWKADAIKYTGIISSNNGGMVYNGFLGQLKSVFGSMENAEKAHRTAMYGNMTSSEIRKEIASKYPPAGQITLRQFYYMTREMSLAGVDEEMSKVIDEVHRDYKSDLHPDIMREALFDKPLDLKKLCDMYNGTSYTGYVSRGTGRVLQDLLDIRFDARGNAFPVGIRYNNYDALIKEFSQTAKNWTEADYKKWIDSRSSQMI